VKQQIIFTDYDAFCPYCGEENIVRTDMARGDIYVLNTCCHYAGTMLAVDKKYAVVFMKE
jgi:predicted RNA-binding Zn-ribbon protein involved in translation (DUF1610 family)